ncbi:MAG TPA: sigma factor-like helix-turn-helix DNA-binding protein [Actinomycetota bacterium]|nr:sigma factor-like helix-turn-helix DNA-binding protein [Actinomycetota bacterium]
MADDGFATFYASSYRRLLGQLFAVTGDLAEAENLLQEAYARAFVRWSRVGAYDLPEAVRRVAINLAAMADRSLRRRARALLRLGPPPLVPELSPELLDLRDALAALPLGQRQVIVLHHLVGLPVEEVAGELRLATGTVKSRLARGRAAMASTLQPDRSEVS